MPEEVVIDMKTAKEKGESQYKVFVERLKKNIYAPIKKNSCSLFAEKIQKKRGSKSAKISTMKSDINLFSRMYIACQSRAGDMEKFFRHENHHWPPALAHNGNMRGPENKSDILMTLEPLASKVNDVLGVEMKAIDGSALTHSLDPKTFKGEKLKDFSEYAEKLFLLNILQKLEGCQRCDIIFDVYKADSLKHNTRVARVRGER